MHNKPCLAAYADNSTPVGLMALKAHFDTALEIWWLAVDPDRRRQGIGREQVNHARHYAEQHAYLYILLHTLGPRDNDPHYARTRAFYHTCGFTELVERSTTRPNPIL